MLIVSAGQSVAWTVGIGRGDALALQTAAERLFDEVFAPLVLSGADRLLPSKTLLQRVLRWFALRFARNNMPEARAYYVQFIAGLLQALGFVINAERVNAQAVGAHGNGPGVGVVGAISPPYSGTPADFAAFV